MTLPPPTPSVVDHCYRHPDREAGRYCTRCGRPACSDCLVQAAVGSHCLECAKAAKPDVRTRAMLWNARQQAVVTMALIAVNLVVFVAVGLTDTSTLANSGDISKLQFDIGLNKPLLQFNHEWYRLVTAGFLHFGIIHIAFNMILLYQLGRLLEPAIGRTRFTMLYFAALLAGSFGSLLLDPINSISGGASGAIFGLLTAAAIGLHSRGFNIFSTGIGTVLILNLVLTFTVSNISIGAHVGGAIAGVICGLAMLAPHGKPNPKWVGYATPFVVALVAVVGSVIVVG